MPAGAGLLNHRLDGLVASLGGLLFGFDRAVISGTYGFVEQQFHLSEFQVGRFGSSALVGCIVGAAIAGTLGDRFAFSRTIPPLSR